jgi:hypothetical protein
MQNLVNVLLNNRRAGDMSAIYVQVRQCERIAGRKTTRIPGAGDAVADAQARTRAVEHEARSRVHDARSVKYEACARSYTSPYTSRGQSNAKRAPAYTRRGGL